MTRLLALSALGLILAAAPPASAGVASEARVSGLYRVVFVKVAGKAFSGGASNHIWSAVPSCKDGPCATRVRSRNVGEKAYGVFAFNFDGTTYEWANQVQGALDCVQADDVTVEARKAYDTSNLSRFRVTRMSASGRALVFKGTFSTRVTANAVGRAHGCGSYYTDTERFTGYAITAP